MTQYYFTALDIYSWVDKNSKCLEASELVHKIRVLNLCHFQFNNNFNRWYTTARRYFFWITVQTSLVSPNKVTSQPKEGLLCHPKTSKLVFFFNMK